MLADYLLGRHDDRSEELYRRRQLIYRSGTRVSMLAGFVTGSALALAYLFVAIQGIRGAIDAGGVVLVVGAFTTVSVILGNISSTFVAVDQHTTFLDDYFSFLRIGPLVPVAKPTREIPKTFEDGIEFDHVTFTYPGGTEPAIENLSLHIRGRELVALVGENGSGKSTLIKLLLRYYDPTSGAIRAGGADLRELDLNDWRKHIGVMFQDYATYELSIRDNVQMGRPDMIVDEIKVIESLQRARSDRLLEQMPTGLDGKVGRLFEGGHDLSGGEWQRLALARTIYRDADIWILDEPASSLADQIIST